VKRRKRAVAPDLVPRLDVPEDEQVRGADGWLLKPGRTVRRPPHYSPTLEVEVPGFVGVVSRLYRREPGGRILVDCIGDAKLHAGGLYTTTPDRLRRSSAQVAIDLVRD